MIKIKTLEDILKVLGSEKPFLEHVNINADGERQPFTESGAKAYDTLTNILYAVGEITKVDVNDIIETLDNIADEE